MTATEERTCGECKAAFQGKRAGSKYCSEACRQRHYRNAKRDVTDTPPKDQNVGTKKEAETGNPASSWIGRTIFRVVVPYSSKIQPTLEEAKVVASNEEFIFLLGRAWPSNVCAEAIALNWHLLKDQGSMEAGTGTASGVRHTYFLDKDAAWKTLLDLLLKREREKAAKKAKEKRDRARWGGSSWTGYEEPAGASSEEPKASSRQKKASSGPDGSSNSGHRDFNPRRGRAAMLITEALQVLGLKAGYTIADAKRAYRRLAHEHHPDKGGEQTAFVRLKHAYDLAMDHAKATAGARAG